MPRETVDDINTFSLCLEGFQQEEIVASGGVVNSIGHGIILSGSPDHEEYLAVQEAVRLEVRLKLGVGFLSHGDTFCQVTRPVWIQSSFDGHMIRKQLKRNYIDDGRKERVHLGRHFHEAI